MFPAQNVMRWLVALVGCAIAVAPLPTRADDDLPGRVGRVANVQGTLYHAPEESTGDWAEIGLNYPIAQGDNLWADHDGRAEIDYGGGQFRLAGDANLHVSRLDDRQLALFIATGRVIVRVRVLEPDDSVRIDTPASQVALTRPGLYRIDVAPDSPYTTVIVREGEAQVATPSGTAQVLPGQTASSTGVEGEDADIRDGGGIDAFDAWSAARDRVYEAPRQNAYVSRQMIGQADLDAYGTWQAYPEYGAVWFPTSVEPDWAPYRFGHWTWLSGWGYTWVDQAPWGYAPFHYGRWAHIGGRWGWCPGTFVARPAWAPALVAWYGGAGWTHAGSPGGPVYGWVPLGWREPFMPWSGRCTNRCWTRYNRPYAVNLAERRDAPPTQYANWRVPGGITAVSGTALAGGKPVAINRVPISSGAAFTPSPLTRPPAIKPVTPVRPAVRAESGVPAPASTLYTARVPIPPAPPASRVRAVTSAPGGPVTRTGAMPAAPAPSPSRAAAPIAPPVRGLPPMPLAGSTRDSMRIDDGRNVLPPAGVRVAPSVIAPSAGMRSVPPAAAVPVERSFRTAPLPQRMVTPPVVTPAPPPATLPRPVPPATSGARPVPVPQAAMPTPLPQAVAPAPPAHRAGSVRVAPPNPGPADRPN